MILVVMLLLLLLACKSSIFCEEIKFFQNKFCAIYFSIYGDTFLLLLCLHYLFILRLPMINFEDFSARSKARKALGKLFILLLLLLMILLPQKKFRKSRNFCCQISFFSFSRIPFYCVKNLSFTDR